MTISPIGKTTLWFALGLAGSIMIGAMIYANIRRLTDDSRWVAHSHKVLEEIEGAHSALLSSETAQRGYIITGKSGDLEPYRAAIKLIDVRLADLRGLT